GKPDLPWRPGDFSRGAGALSERADAHACGTGDAVRAGPGSAGSDACGKSREADYPDSGFSQSYGHFHAAGVPAQTATPSRTFPGAGGGRPHLRAVAFARGTHPVTKTAR